MKNDVMQALRGENTSLINRIKMHEAHFESSDIIRNQMDQYSCHNNLVIDDIPSSVKKSQQNDKCIEVFGENRH